MNIKPLHDKVVVKADAVADKTEGGLFLADSAKERQQEGTVVAAGPGRVHETTGQFKATQVKPGDRVLFAKYAGAQFQLNGEEVLMLDEGDVLAILTND
jgi:chaperonin GroES